MTEKPNCSTCPHFRTTHHGNECAESRTYLPLPAKALIEHVGCLSHPNAREYLMAPVEKYVIPVGDYAYIAHGKKPSLRIDGAATILVMKE